MAFSGYSINGIPLHDASRGWRTLRDGTQTQGGITKSLSKVGSPGRPGYTPAPSTFTEQAIIFVVSCARSNLDSLLTLCDAANTLTRTDDSTKFAKVQLASALVNGDAPMDTSFEVTITLIAYEGAWRDVSDNDFGPVAVTTPVQSFQLFTDISAPVFDAQVFIRGVFGQFTLTDSDGSSLKTTQAWPGTATTGLLYIGATQQAFFANDSSPFVPVSDAGQYVDVSGNGGFRLTPSMVSGNPATRQVSLSLTTLSQTSTTLRVRAKRAYRMN